RRVADHSLAASAVAIGRGVLAVSAADGAVAIHSLDSGARVRTLRGHAALVASLEFCPDGAQLATPAADKSVPLHDAGPAAEVAVMREANLTGTFLAFDPRGRYLLAGTSHAGPAIWDLRSPRAIALITSDPGLSGRFVPDGSAILFGTGNGSITSYPI